MTQFEATTLATQLLASYGNRAFEVSMPDKEGYDLMRSTFTGLGRANAPDGEFFVVRVLSGDAPPVDQHQHN